MTTQLEVIDAATWDVVPLRTVLLGGLRGRTFVHGPHAATYLEEGERGGLWSFRPVEPDEVPKHLSWRTEHAYAVDVTASGIELAIRIAHSEELCVLFDAFVEMTPARWKGIDPGRILSELDLRAGGDGHESRRMKTASMCRHCLGKLPRRGLDEPSTAHQRD